MNASPYTPSDIALASWIWIERTQQSPEAPVTASPLQQPKQRGLDLLLPLRRWLDSVEVRNPQLAHRLCQLIPSQCPPEAPVTASPLQQPKQRGLDLLLPLRRWLDSVEVRNPQLAHRLCQLIPSQCPFERDVVLFGRKLFHIPPMCKLNPLYEEVVSLRFRALCYLADECGEDVTRYC